MLRDLRNTALALQKEYEMELRLSTTTCPCHDEAWHIYGNGKRVCQSKLRERKRRVRTSPEGRAKERAREGRKVARKRLAADNHTKKLGKLLNLSVNGATEHERRLARQKYNQLKGVKVA